MSDAHWKIGANYLIRTATMIDAGKLVAVNAHDELVSALKIVANWPVSQPFDNQDAMNMAKIAIDALSKLGD